MQTITVLDALNLSIPERIQLVEDIWDTIALNNERIELPENEKKIIEDRLNSYKKNNETGATWQQVYNRITTE